MDIKGKYRNGVGSEIEIVRLIPGKLGNTQVIGTLYEAVQRSSLFGNTILLITPAGLSECGYEKVEDKK